MKYLTTNKTDRIMIRSTNWIGDAVMTTPAMNAVRETFPHAHIAVVANPLVAQLFEKHPDCDEVIVFDKKKEHSGLMGFLRFVFSLRKKRFDCAILMQNAIEAAIMAVLAGITARAGYATDNRRLLLTHAVPLGEQEKSLHHTDYYLHMLAQCGVKTKSKLQQLALTTEEIRCAEELVSSAKYVVINPGAAYGSAKRWIPERFAAVADALASQYGLDVVLTGGPAEVEIGLDISKAMKVMDLNLIGKTSVRQLMAIIAGSRMMVTNDSGPMHVGAAFNIPIVAIFGPTDHKTTSPWGTRAEIVRQDVECSPCLLRQCPIDHRCMERVTVEQVLSAAGRLLGEQP